MGVWRKAVWGESVGDWGPGLLDALSRIEDPRKPKGVRHPLPAVLALSVCAMLSGARSLYAIAQWGREHPQLARSLGFSREQTPSVATLHHVFRRLDVDAFESALGRWAQECLGEDEATIAIDGKALRGNTAVNCRECGWWRHTLGRAAWYWDKRAVRGDRKESELGMASGLLGQLELRRTSISTWRRAPAPVRRGTLPGESGPWVLAPQQQAGRTN